LEKRYNPGLNLPDIFRRLIPHMLDGSWSLEQVGQLLTPPAPAPIPAAASASAARSAKPQPEIGTGSKARPQQPEQGTLPLEASSAVKAATDTMLRYRRDVPEDSGGSGFNLRPWLLGGAAALVVCIIVIWHFVSAKPAQNGVPTTSASAAQSAPTPVRQLAARPAIVADHSITPARTAGWYVIAWTYNHQSQAQAKADRINALFHGFHAEVFSPHGRAPYLISLGGPMSEPQAKELQQRARRSGLPRDTYIRNYR
jgi:hypothetical protein